MALNKDFQFSGSGSTIGMQALEPINYGSDQTVSQATSGIMKAARGIFVTTGGTLVIQTKGNTDTKSVPFPAGRHEIEITGVISSGSATLVGFYYF